MCGTMGTGGCQQAIATRYVYFMRLQQICSVHNAQKMDCSHSDTALSSLSSHWRNKRWMLGWVAVTVSQSTSIQNHTNMEKYSRQAPQKRGDVKLWHNVARHAVRTVTTMLHNTRRSYTSNLWDIYIHIKRMVQLQRTPAVPTIVHRHTTCCIENIF